jgi:TRAP-type C4-dicarboxylate transport system permease small subunit
MEDQSSTEHELERLSKAFEEDMPSAADLSGYAIEDWLSLLIFWAMAFCVILQFITRYVLNDSLAWTEEIASYALVLVVFFGSVTCVRQARHIRVDILLRLLPAKASRWLGLLVELGTIGFFVYGTNLMWRYAGVMADEQMVTIRLPAGFLYWGVFVAFSLMAIRAIILVWREQVRGKPLETSDEPAGI